MCPVPFLLDKVVIVPSHFPASLLCFLQERAAAKAAGKEGELAAALSEKDS